MARLLGPEGASRYVWGADCDAFVLCDAPGLRVVRELMPPGRVERLHHHAHAQQLFYVLSGVLTVAIAGEASFRVESGHALRVAPGERHQARNEGVETVEFVVISQPSTDGDRTE